MKVIFLGCHSDDIELGCGGTIYKHREDWDISCLVFCRKGKKQGAWHDISGVATRSLSKLGARTVQVLDFEPDKFSDYRQDVYDHLARIKELEQPCIVFTQAADEHQDHVTLNQESLRVFRQQNMYEYLSTYRSMRSFCPNTYEILDIEHVDAKVKAMQEYFEFYVEKKFMRPSAVMASMSQAGIYVGVDFCEAFRVVTKINTV